MFVVIFTEDVCSMVCGSANLNFKADPPRTDWDNSPVRRFVKSVMEMLERAAELCKLTLPEFFPANDMVAPALVKALMDRGGAGEKGIVYHSQPWRKRQFKTLGLGIEIKIVDPFPPLDLESSELPASERQTAVSVRQDSFWNKGFVFTQDKLSLKKLIMFKCFAEMESVATHSLERRHVIAQMQRMSLFEESLVSLMFLGSNECCQKAVKDLWPLWNRTKDTLSLAIQRLIDNFKLNYIHQPLKTVFSNSDGGNLYEEFKKVLQNGISQEIINVLKELRVACSMGGRDKKEKMHTRLQEMFEDDVPIERQVKRQRQNNFSPDALRHIISSEGHALHIVPSEDQ